MTFPLSSKSKGRFLFYTCCPSGQVGRGIEGDEHISHIAQDIQKQLPELFDINVVGEELGTDLSPTSVVLLQELRRFNKLVLCMQQSVAELLRVSREKMKKQQRKRSSW